MALLQDFILAAVAAIGFGMLFNIPWRFVVFCGLIGGLGHGLRFWLHVNNGFSLELATLVGATLIGFSSYFLGRRFRVPQLIFAIAAVIPMIPGTYAYQTMIGAAELVSEGGGTPEMLVNTSVTALKTAFIIAALAIGVAVPQLVLNRKSPIV
ncbi:MAG: hypothetical protein CMF25_03300 [Kangiellaceae bacterium]|jgi:uncharacterized membrane protein YjjB (DUF3815 family)|nr:hypothetical protein [Kangiellaceae bacterium]|tara:strand:- start:51874 stop:52332 length:459 start_codon:yes stop_codon:yes gene_type:complete